MDDMVGEMSADKRWMCNARLDAPCWAGVVGRSVVAVLIFFVAKLRGW